MKPIESPGNGTMTLPKASAPAFTPHTSAWRPGRIGLVVLIVIILCVFAGLIPRWHQKQLLKVESRELAVPTVSVVSPKLSKGVAGLVLPAEIRAFAEAPIYARASGYLKRWLVDIGSTVEAGQLLAEIDTPEINQELVRARAELVQANAALALAKTTAARWTELLKSTSVSQQEAAEKQADFELKQANVDAAKANVRRLEEMEGFSQVTAPFAGMITARQIDVGALISATNGKELFRLAQTKTLRVYVRVPQSAARGIAPGVSAQVTIPELPGRVFTARVTRTSGAMSTESRTLLTELQLDNEKGEILAGSYAQVRFDETSREESLTLPANTLLFRAEGAQVGLVTKEGKVDLRNISIGRDFGQTYEVLDGVQPSDRVILNPPDAIVAGESVRVLETKTDAASK